jgi:hypothetical protein
MRLIKFKVTNFRSVTDSGWIEAETVTALIGVNESGKTNLLLPLWKLNPAREGEIKPTSDYPKANYAAVREDPASFIFITAEFEISELAGELASMTGAEYDVLNVVQVSRFFDGNYSITFPKHKPVRAVQAFTILELVESAAKEIKTISSLTKEASLKPEMLKALDSASDEIRGKEPFSSDGLSHLASTLKRVLPENPASTSSIVPRFRLLLESIATIEAQLNAPPPSETEGVAEYIVERIPRFVYYSNYGNLDSEIYLPHVVQNLEREDLGAREAAKARTLRVLFSFVRLQPNEILELGRDFRDPQGEAANRKSDRGGRHQKA